MRWWWLCFALGLGWPGTAAAALGKIDVGETVMASGGGHLPVGPGVTREEAIAAAYALPAVQAAITYMGSRGYVAYPVYDEAALLPSAPATFVALSYEKPGLIPPGFDILGAPMILIGTVKDVYGNFHTSVAGGLAFVDTLQRTMWTADSLPAMYPGDASWEVVPAGGDGDGGGFKRISPTARSFAGPYSFTFGGTNSPEDQKFRKFVHCSAIGLGAAALNALWQGPPIPQKVVLQSAIMGVIAVVSCGVGAYGGVAP